MNLKKKVVTSIATIGLVGALVGGATLAMFTDIENTTGSFQAGKVDLAVCPEVVRQIPCMAPGDSGSYTILVENKACLPLLWKADLNLAGALAQGDTPLVASLTDMNGNLIPDVDDTSAAPLELAPGQSMTVKVNYSLPFEAKNQYALTTADMNVKFLAEQKANNVNPFAPGNVYEDAIAPDLNLP